MKRIIFVNLHSNAFIVRTLDKFLFKRSVAIKHKYILDYLLGREDIHVCSYINDYGFSLYKNGSRLSRTLAKLFGRLEHFYIMRKNGIDRRKVELIKASQITADDILVSYVNGYDTLQQIAVLPAFKVSSAIHFLGEKLPSVVAKTAGIQLFFDESNLKKFSKAFQVRYDWYNKDVLVHPFVFAPRFKKTTPFSERECRCFSTGTIIDLPREEFTEIYGDPCNQPTRRQVYENQEELKPYIECTNNYYLEDDKLKQVKPNDNFIVKAYKVYYNQSHTGRQKKYFSFDMVERFNHFKMFLVGEEVVGIPGIGFVEGMACGGAFIGQDFGIYEQYGMQEGVHYIGYDGTLEDLKAKISYYQQPEHQEELERIANAGYEFAQTHFRGEIVAKELLDKLQKAHAEWKASK
jgi:hypothetical protein